jgi:putative tricarboxylic transport membrane protein
MSSSRRSDIVVALIVILLSVAVFLYTYTFPETHRSVGVASFPRLLTAIMAALAGMLLHQTWRRRPAAESTADGAAAGGGSIDSAEPIWDRAVLTRVGIVSLMIAGYVALVQTLGFVLTSVIFLSTTIRYFGERRPVRLLLVAITVTAAVYLLFGVLAGVPFPPGRIFRGLWG